MKPEEQLNTFIKNFKVDIIFNPVIKGKRVYHVPEEVLKASEEIKADYYSIGIPLGEASSEGFKPSLALLDLLKSSMNRVMINDNGEWMFVCGRDVFENNVLKDEQKSTPFLVVNKRYEVLGLGKWYAKGKNKFVKPILDRGDFLRREEKRKKRR